MKLLTKEQQDPKICDICQEKFKNVYVKDKKISES